MNSRPPPPSEPARFHVARFVFWSLGTSIWVMFAALHVPLEKILPPAAETIFYPSFRYFMPLTIWYSAWLPWPSALRSLPALTLMCAMDFLLMSVICLPLLVSPGRRQNILSAVSLTILLAYSTWSLVSFLTIAKI